LASNFCLHRWLNPANEKLQQNLKTLEAADTQVVGVSMDSPFANNAFAQQIGVTFLFLSDWAGKSRVNTAFTRPK